MQQYSRTHIFFSSETEATPFKRALGVQRDSSCRMYPCYQAKSIRLHITGQGPLEAASIAGAALRDETAPIVVSVGIAASRDIEDLGKLFLVNAIKDGASGRSFYPDIHFRHELCEASLLSSALPVDPTEAERLDPKENFRLFDMESSGIFTAAKHLTSPERIILLKIASDQLEPTHVSKDRVTELCSGHTDTILHFLSSLGPKLESSTASLSKEETIGLDQLIELGRFSFSEQQMLFDWAYRFRARQPGKSLLHELESYLEPKESTLAPGRILHELSARIS